MIHPVGGSHSVQEAQSAQQKTDRVESAPKTSGVTGFGGDRVNVSAEAKALALAENQAAEHSGHGDMRDYRQSAPHHQADHGSGAATRGEQALANVAAEDVHGAAREA